MSYQSVVEADGPQYYWPMNEQSGDAIDVIGGVHLVPGHGVNQEAPGWYTELGTCWQFDGVNDDAVSGALFDGNDYDVATFEGLFYWDNETYLSNSTLFEIGWETYAAAAADGGIWMTKGDEQAILHNMNSRLFDGDAIRVAIAKPSYAAWHHLTMVVKGNVPDIDAYVDGSPVTRTILASDRTGKIGKIGTNFFLRLMCNGGTEQLPRLSTLGKAGHFAIYTKDLGATAVANHFAALNEGYTAVGGIAVPHRNISDVRLRR